MADERARAREKHAAIERAEFNLQVALQRIDHKHDVLIPSMEQHDQLALEGMSFDTTLVELANDSDNS